MASTGRRSATAQVTELTATGTGAVYREVDAMSTGRFLAVASFLAVLLTMASSSISQTSGGTPVSLLEDFINSDKNSDYSSMFRMYDDESQKYQGDVSKESLPNLVIAANMEDQTLISRFIGPDVLEKMAGLSSEGAYILANKIFRLTDGPFTGWKLKSVEITESSARIIACASSMGIFHGKVFVLHRSGSPWRIHDLGERDPLDSKDDLCNW